MDGKQYDPNFGFTYSNNPTSCYFEGTDSVDLKLQSTYAGWDFNTIWEMDSNTGYPRLQWEKNIK